MSVTTGTKRDWQSFSQWHYRSHEIGLVRHVAVLWDRVGDEDERAVGICVFTTAPVSLAGRRKFFGLQGKWTKLGLKALNEQVVLLSRVVLHPTYRGAGIGAEFIRRSCESCGWRWVETLTELGRRNPVFERAGFMRVPTEAKGRRDRAGHSAIYGTRRGGYGRKRLVSEETYEKSRFSNPAYYIFDNRGNVGSRRGGG